MTKKLEQSLSAAHRGYRTARKTTLRGGMIRKEPKGIKKTPIAEKVSDEQLIDSPTRGKKRVVPMLPTTSRNAVSGAISDGPRVSPYATCKN
jgi:hypothetical protein